jgi:hypothetical protein
MMALGAPASQCCKRRRPRFGTLQLSLPGRCDGHPAGSGHLPQHQAKGIECTADLVGNVIAGRHPRVAQDAAQLYQKRPFLMCVGLRVPDCAAEIMPRSAATQTRPMAKRLAYPVCDRQQHGDIGVDDGLPDAQSQERS